MTLGKGSQGEVLTDEELALIFRQGLEEAHLERKKILVIIPDSTRTAPIPLCFRTLSSTLLGKVKRLDVLIALGTHPPMSEAEIDAHLGTTEGERARFKVRVFNHTWDRPEELQRIGTIPASEIEEISHGLLSEQVRVKINRRIFDYDHLIIIGPVFPHEVVGFSGGYKYFFPGISGPAMVHHSHWLGALITNPKVSGTKRTPVRDVINRAASFVEIPTTLFALVMLHHTVHGLYVGDSIAAWERAADLSAKINIVWVKHPFHTVLAAAPAMYQELWTAGKCMYKLEPVVEDGGKVIIYAPNLHKISVTHGDLIREIGYHTRDYFLSQWDHFKDVPGAILAHSSHVRGIGTYRNKVEYDRIEVILSTQIPETTCRAINLGYLNPNEVDLDHFANRQDDGVLLVPKAGEILYRLADGSVPDIDLL